jgi:terminase small subunit-like protein
MAELNVRHKKFIEEYLKHGNGSKAVIACGMSANGASVTANRFLKDPRIAAEIARRRSVSEKRAELNAEMVMSELRNLVASNPKDFYDEHGNLKPINELPDDVAKTISSLEMAEKGSGVKKLKTHSKLGAIELASKLLGMLKDQESARASVTIVLAEAPQIERPAEGAVLLPEWE